MPRPQRVNIAGIPQHLVQRGNNRQACFHDEADYQLYLELLASACNKHSCVIHAYVLMTNHVHLLATPTQPDGISLMFRDLGRDYVRQFNRRHGRTGTLWEGRFKSSLIETDQYLLACYRYIELNPVRAGIVEGPGDYQWSSFRANAYSDADTLVVPHDLWLALGPDDSARQQAYLSLFNQALSDEQDKVIRKGLNKGLPTGNDQFKRRIEAASSIQFGTGKVGRPRSRP